MKEYNWYLRRAALVLFPSSALSLAFTAVSLNKAWAIPAGASIEILSLMAAMFLVRVNSPFSLWSIIVSGTMMIMGVTISATFLEHSFLWLAHAPGWGAGAVYWLLLWECKDSLLLVSFSFFVSVEAVFLAVFLGKMLGL